MNTVSAEIVSKKVFGIKCLHALIPKRRFRNTVSAEIVFKKEVLGIQFRQKMYSKRTF